MFFVRLYGCNLSCGFCDTKYAIKGGGFEERDSKKLADQIRKQVSGERVCITGGEPLFQDISIFVKELLYHGFKVHIETNGTYSLPADIARDCWWTVSPKGPVKGETLALASELKFVVDSHKFDFGKLMDYSKERVWLQPEGTRQDMTDLCVLKAKKYGWNVSVQVHKLIGVK